jgi:hypothetical protein
VKATALGHAAVVFLTCAPEIRFGTALTFEVIEPEAAGLKRLVHTIQTFRLDRGLDFLAELSTLEPCIKDKDGGTLTLRGVLNVRNTARNGK